MTVKEAFKLAFGDFGYENPQDPWRCYFGYIEGVQMEWQDVSEVKPILLPVVSTNSNHRQFPRIPKKSERSYWEIAPSKRYKTSPYGPDISKRPAKAFLGFFGEAYDQVVNATKSPSD